jgi:phage shock protein E
MTDLHLSFVFLLVVGSTAMALLAAGCLGGGPGTADQEIRAISPAEASALIEGRGDDPKFVVIDVRRPEEFAGGHIPGAININSADFPDRIGGLDPDGTYLLCCLRGVRSSGVRELMREAGFREVYDIEGGMSAWKAAGLPVTG